MLDIPEGGSREHSARATYAGSSAASSCRGRLPTASRCSRRPVTLGSCTPHHVVCDRTAAWLHGIDVFVWAELDLAPVVETCALRGHEAQRHHRRAMRAPATSAPSDIIHCARRHGSPLLSAPALDLSGAPRGARRRDRRTQSPWRPTRLLTRGGLPPDYCRGIAGVAASASFDALLQIVEPRRRVRARVLGPARDPRRDPARPGAAVLDRDRRRPDVPAATSPTRDFALCRRVRRRGVAPRRHLSNATTTRPRRGWLRANGWTVIVRPTRRLRGLQARDRWIGELRAALRPAYTNRRW